MLPSRVAPGAKLRSGDEAPAAGLLKKEEEKRADGEEAPSAPLLPSCRAAALPRAGVDSR
jgi:hypothetical protein